MLRAALKTIDFLSPAFPRMMRSLIGPRIREGMNCIIRPGGLGDMVILSMAARKIGLDPWRLVWIVENRNKAWCELLQLPFIAYDSIAGISLAASASQGFSGVINTEQFFGLSACLSARLTNGSGRVIGFDTNRARQFHDINIPHPMREQHEINTFELLLREAVKQLGLHLTKRDWHLPHELGRANREDYVVLVIGGRQSTDRRIPLGAWDKLVHLCQRYSNQICLIGADYDTSFGVELMVRYPAITKNLVGRIHFAEVCQLIAGARRVIGIDSGLIHVASFFDTPTSALFTRENMRQRWAPLSAQSESIMAADL